MAKLTSVRSAHAFDETVRRVEGQLDELGVPVFAKIDHAANARGAGLELPPTTVLVFGAARGGTPAMQARPDVAYDLPLRLLVRQDADGVALLYRPVDDLAAGYGLSAEVAKPLHLVEKVAAGAAAAD